MNPQLPVAQRMQKARTTLLLDHPFFGSLLFRLQGRESRSVATMATDGISIYYNPDFVATLNSATLCGVLAHEVMHPALQHHVRRAGRDPKRWNRACDYAINPLLLDAGLCLPDGVLVEDCFREMSAEQIYNLLEPEQPSQQAVDEPGRESSAATENSSRGQNDIVGPDAPVTEGGVGQVLDAPPPDASTPDRDAQSREWSIAVSQAVTLGKRAGKLPSGMGRTLERAAEASVNWREMLRRLWSETIATDYSWTRPNRRHLWNGTYLPGIQKEGVGVVAIAVDCSGSVSARQLGLFEAEVRSIFEEQNPERVYVLYFDACVQKIETYESGQRISLKPAGGGGTDFGPCFEWLDQQSIRPQTLVFLTDLYGSFPDTAPPYPVLWASTGGRHAPFGSVIPLQST